MDAWWWVPVAMTAWFVIALAVGLWLGPVLRRWSQASEAAAPRSQMPAVREEPVREQPLRAEPVRDGRRAA